MQQIKNLLLYLKAYSPKIMSINPQKKMLSSVALIEKETDFQSSVIYVGMMSQILYQLRFLEDITFFLICDSDIELQVNEKSNSIVLFPKETDLLKLTSACKTFIDNQRQVYESTYLLMDAFLSQSSLQEMIDLTAKQIKNSVMIIDNSYRVLYSAGNDLCDDLQWQENIRRGYCSYEYVSQFNRLSEIRMISEAGNPVLAGCTSSPLRRCIIQLHSEKKELGYLLSLEANNHFDEPVLQFLKTAGELLSKMLYYSALKDQRGMMSNAESVIIDLLEGRFANYDSFIECMRYSKLPLQSKYYCVYIDIENYNVISIQMEVLKEAMKRLFPHSISVLYQKNVILVVNYEENIRMMIEKIATNQSVFNEMGLCLTISDQFENLLEIPFYFKQAKHARDLIKQLMPEKIIGAYDDIRSADMLLAQPNQKNYQQYIDLDSLAIYQYDQVHGTNYLDTLYYYVLFSRSNQKTAEKLHIHKNTVAYRISKIKEMFQLDLNDALTRMSIYNSYRLIQLYASGIISEA
ncbi:helix-turn-helix domain-containing protein [Acetobacterium wieringae]|uniref:Helix-turn-helix domain-containing protein n=1 Tax=Acetobacterium wieringae TaxID=52694 RepID=A0ABY6HIW0_9FIRM|nr:helix-turn-helix domain-containing protein [Acetobacterium wieringae]UYO64353.1 helix-turn-helix domain-containing protein [Acetobacterium wieringae]VUZ27130.1 Uncharacterised protein [Acetobacterium wieringae]